MLQQGGNLLAERAVPKSEGRVIPALDPITTSDGTTLELRHPWERKGGWEDDAEHGVSHVDIMAHLALPLPASPCGS